MKKKKFKKFNRNAWIVSQLRRISLRWPERNEAIKMARVSRGLYRCAICKRENVTNKEKKLDHKITVVALNSLSLDLNAFCERLLVNRDQYQLLCSQCHSNKTIGEQAIRKFYKQQNKKK